VADHRHQERVAGRLEVADHRHAVEAAIEQQEPGPDPDACGLSQEAPDHVLERLALGHAGHGHGVALPLADDVGGGIGVEVAGAVLGLAAVDLAEVAEGLAVVGDQRQVDGQPLEVSAQRLGQVTGEGRVELPLQLGIVGERRQQRLAGRLVRGGVAEPPAGVGERGDAGGGGQQQRPEDRCRGLPLVVLELEVGLQVRGGGAMDLVAVERMILWAHGSLR
jgi:hypothetical protein